MPMRGEIAIPVRPAEGETLDEGFGLVLTLTLVGLLLTLLLATTADSSDGSLFLILQAVPG